MTKRAILIDFDGTVNSYKSGFDDTQPWTLPDPPNPGAIGFVRRLVTSPYYRPVIFTTRVYDELNDCDNPRVVYAIRDWFTTHGLERHVAQQLEVTSRKIKGCLIIDDNAFRFEGTWPTPADIDRLTAKRHKGESK